MRGRVAHETFRLGGVAEIGGDGPSLTTGGSQFLDELLGFLARCVVVHRDAHPACGQRDGDRAPDAPAGAGHERDAPCERECHAFKAASTSAGGGAPRSPKRTTPSRPIR